MSLLYVNDSGATIGIEGNCCTVKQKDGSKRMLPIESLDGITIMGQSQMTTQCAEECMQRGIPVSYFSKGGKYFGRLISTGHVNVERQRKQCALYDTGFAVELAMKILSATTLIISKKPGNTGISRDIRTEFTTDLLLSD